MSLEPEHSLLKSEAVFETGLRTGDWFFDYGKIIDTAHIPGFTGITGVLVEFEMEGGAPPLRVEMVYNEEELAQLTKQLQAYGEQKIADAVIEE